MDTGRPDLLDAVVGLTAAEAARRLGAAGHACTVHTTGRPRSRAVLRVVRARHDPAGGIDLLCAPFLPAGAGQGAGAAPGSAAAREPAGRADPSDGPGGAGRCA